MASRSRAASRQRDDERRLADAVAAVAHHLRVPGTGEPLVPYPEQVAGARALLRGAAIIYQTIHTL